MSSRAGWRWAVAGAVLALAGCHRSRVYVHKIGIAPSMPGPIAGRTADEWLTRFRDGVGKLSGVAVVAKDKPAPVQQFDLTLLPAVELAPQGGQAIALVMIRRLTQDSGERYDVLASEAFDRQAGHAAEQAAMEKALASVLEDTRLQMLDFEKPDDALIAELHERDAHARRFAVRALTERSNPAAIPALEEQLSSADLDAVREAIGGLVQLHDQKVVPAIIEAAHNRPLEFQRELLFALGEIGGDEARAYLYTVASGADQPQIRDAAQRALDQLSPRPDGGA